jgi:uncharacterized protein (UPF0332 family)
MIDEKRINEARTNVNSYILDGLLKKVQFKDNNVKNILLNNCKESLRVAEIIFNNNYSNLWTIVCSYYSMYYIANAVLYELGFKVGDKVSHKVASDALIIYVMNKLKQSLIEDYEEAKEEALEISGIKAEEIIESFDVEREKRSKFQYTTTEIVMKAKAKTSPERAKRFVFEIEKLMSDLK